MRQLLVLAFIANVVLGLYAWGASPELIASHFDGDGRPNDWMSRTVNAVVVLGLTTMVFLLFFYMPQLLRTAPDRWLSLPNKEYWLHPARRALFEEAFTRLMDLFGAATLALMFVVEWLALRANLSDPVRLAAGPFWLALGGYLVFTVVWLVWLWRAFRVPEPGTGR